MGAGERTPLTWSRYVGLAMLAVGLLYLPAALAPLHNRLVALLSILFRGGFALFFLFASGLLWLPALSDSSDKALESAGQTGERARGCSRAPG